MKADDSLSRCTRRHASGRYATPALRWGGALIAVLATLLLTAAPASAHLTHVYTTSFGSRGSGAGELELQSAGYSPKLGSGLAVDDVTGDVYVADTENHRIAEFEANGEFVRAWGWGVSDGRSELQTCTTTCEAGISGSHAGELEAPAFVAVDNSGAESEGDVYVGDAEDDTITKFDATGELVGSWGADGQLTKAGGFSFGAPEAAIVGIATTPAGDLWVRTAHTEDGSDGAGGEMLELSANGALLTSWAYGLGYSLGPGGIAAAPNGALYLSTGEPIGKYEPDGTLIGPVQSLNVSEWLDTGLAVDPETEDELYILEDRLSTPEIGHYSASSCEPAHGYCTPADVFGTGEEVEAGRLVGGVYDGGLAAGPDHLIYAANVARDDVIAYKQVTQPDVKTTGFSALAQSTVTLEGTVNPDGVPLSECSFEYGEVGGFGHDAPCEFEYEPGKTTSDAAQFPVGAGVLTVRAAVTGLASAPYQYRLTARNENRPERGATLSFGAIFESTTVAAVGDTEATLTAKVEPNGLAVTCELQYVSESQYAESGFADAASVPCEPPALQATGGAQPVSASALGLSEGAVYQARFVAVAAAHASDGPAQTLVTYSKSPFSGCGNEALREENYSLELPDCRAFELVSPPGTAEVYVPELSGERSGIPDTLHPFQVATDGGIAAYGGEAPGSSSGGTGNKGPGEGDLLLSTRGEDGWSTSDISPPGEEPESYYEAFSSDLSQAVFYSAQRSLAPGVQGGALYDRDDATGMFAPLFDSEAGTKQAAVTEGLAQDGRDVLFESDAALTEDAKKASAEQLGHGSLYDYAEGSLHLVSVLPGVAEKAVSDATAGGLSGEGAGENESWTTGARSVPPAYASGDFASDGSRVFWTDLETGVIYARLNPAAPQSKVEKGQCSEPEEACTVQVSAHAAVFRTATPDGRYAYYTEAGELWRFDSEDDTSEALAGPGAEVQGVVAVNQAGEDGSYLYFVAAGKLSGEAEVRRCEMAGETNAEQAEEAEGEAPAGHGCNLYLIHEGETKLVTVLLPGDDRFASGADSATERGDWRSVLGYLTAQASPSGKTLAFMSERRLGAYPNIDSEGGCDNGPPHSCAEVYVYDAESGQIACASCDPAGIPPAGREGNQSGGGTYLQGDTGSLMHTARAISADGDRVFFTSDQSLVPEDTNGEPDVYEWEREGTGSCDKGSPFNGGGCVYLLSSGKPGKPGYLLESDEEGENVFIITRAELNPFDSGQEGAALYDARVGGGFAYASSTENGEPACTSGEACKPPPHEPPVQLFAASSAFSGPGNLTQAFELPHSEEHKGTTKPIRKQKLKRALAACRKKDKGKHVRRERQLCEGKARKKYGPRKDHKHASKGSKGAKRKDKEAKR